MKVPLRAGMQAGKVPQSSVSAFHVTYSARLVGKKVVRSPSFYSRPESTRSLSLTKLGIVPQAKETKENVDQPRTK
jgi:hypothetical protein